MKTLAFILCLFTLNTLLAQSEKDVTIPMVRVQGNSLFNMSLIPGIEEKKLNNLKGIPKEIDIYKVWRYNFQPFEAIHQRYIDGELTREEYLKRVNAYKIDTNRLSKIRIKQEVKAFSGLKKDKRVLIFDTNNNNDFSDEKPYQFDTLSIKTGLTSIDTLKSILVSYECFDGLKKVNKDYLVKFLAYDKGSQYIDAIYNKLQVKLGTYQHKLGYFKLNGIDYKIAMVSASLSENYQASNVLIARADSAFKIPKPRYYLGDTLLLDNNRIHLAYASHLGDTLHITYLGKALEQTGFREGDVVSAFNGFSLENSPLPIPAKDQYVLLDFWGTWCKPCINGLPKLKAFYENYKDKLKLISVAYDNDIAKVKSFSKKNNMNWNHIFESNDTEDIGLTKKLAVDCFPTLILINEKGKIVSRVCGENSIDLIEKKLSGLNL